MGGVVPGIAHAIEEGAGVALKEGIQNWATHSGDAFLRSLGDHGVWLADHLKGYESFRDANKSYVRDNIQKVFKEVPEQHHADLENHVLSKPNQLPQQYTPQAKRLKKVQDTVIKKMQQAGVTTNIGGQSIPVVMHPEGPFAHHPDIFSPNSTIRKAAIKEVGDAAVLDKIVRPEFGRQGASHISFPHNNSVVYAGRLPVAQRWQRWGQASAEKVAQNVFFGSKDEHLAAVVRSIYESKGQVSANNVTDFLNLYLHNPAYMRDFGIPESGVKGVEQWIRKVAGYVMTSRIALPHSTQLINSIMNEGLIDTLKGISERVTNWPALRDLVTHSGALEEELNREFQQSIQGKKSLFEKMFHQPGFSWIRQRQAEVSAIAGKIEIEDAFKRLKNGDKRAEHIFNRLGIDPQATLKNGLTDEAKKTAMYNAAKQTIFFRTPLNTPFKREETALGRTVFMYSHYHFNMFRTIKNAMFNSLKEQGPMGLVNFAAKLGIIFPIAGELIVLAENGLYRKDLTSSDIGDVTGNEAIDQYLNTLAHASAFGIIYSINRGHRRNMIESLTVGPIISTGINVGNDVTNAIMGTKTATGDTKRDIRPLERDVLRHIPVVGPTVSSSLVPYDEKPLPHKRPSVRRKKPVDTFIY